MPPGRTDTPPSGKRWLDGELDRYQAEQRYLHADGYQVRVRETVSRLSNHPGEAPFAFALVEDIGETSPPGSIDAADRKGTDEGLLMQALDRIPIGIWFTDRQGKILSGNPAAQALWGASGSGGPGRFSEYKAWFAKTGKPIEEGEWAVTRAVEKGETSLNELIEIEAGDGDPQDDPQFGVPPA